MKARYQYRIYPTDQQKRLLSQLFGCVRVVWNDTLAYCQELYQQGEKKPKYTELSKRLTQVKKTEERRWLTEVSSIPLQQSLRDLETAYSNFFTSCKGERKGKKGFFGLSYAMDGGYKGWNPYIQRHLAIFVNCF